MPGLANVVTLIIGLIGVRAGQRRLLGIEGWPDNQSCRNLLAWLWSGEEGVDGHLVVINLSGQPAQGRVRLDWPRLEGHSWQLVDPVQDVSFDRTEPRPAPGCSSTWARGSSTCSRSGRQVAWPEEPVTTTRWP
jgi:hypothetical protein